MCGIKCCVCGIDLHCYNCWIFDEGNCSTELVRKIFCAPCCEVAINSRNTHNPPITYTTTGFTEEQKLCKFYNYWITEGAFTSNPKYE